MSEELPREEGLPAESEESERWISNLFSALPEGRPNLFSLGVRAAERTEISRVRVCATCRRSLDKLNFSRTQWNKKQVGVSRCWECVSSDLEAPEASERWTTEAEADVPREPLASEEPEAAERKVLCCYVLCFLLFFICAVVAFAVFVYFMCGIACFL